MDKVWFKLRQTDYPPPTPESLGTNTETGPLSLGHFVPDLRQLEFPINRGGIEPFPRSMPVYSTSAISFRWEDVRATEHGGALGGGAPVLAAAGVPITAKAGVETIFKASVAGYEAYERLDTYVVQVNRAYIDDCLETDTIAKYVSEKSKWGSWSMFVITGLKIARVGSRSISSSKGAQYGFEIEGDVPALGSVRAELGVTRDGETTMGAEKHTDFVWAIRLAKVQKNLLMKDWSVEPYTKKATFNDNDEGVDVGRTVLTEGGKNFRLLDDVELGESYIIFLDEEQREVLA